MADRPTHPPFDTMFFLGRGPELFENVTIHFKLAQLEASKRGKSVEVLPFSYFNCFHLLISVKLLISGLELQYTLRSKYY